MSYIPIKAPYKPRAENVRVELGLVVETESISRGLEVVLRKHSWKGASTSSARDGRLDDTRSTLLYCSPHV